MSEISGCETSDIRRLLEQLEKDSIGMLTAHRKNKKEFFVWFYQPKAVAEYLLGDIDSLADHKTCIKQAIERQVERESQLGSRLPSGTVREFILETLEDS
jgi:hypothetical protein